MTYHVHNILLKSVFIPTHTHIYIYMYIFIVLKLYTQILNQNVVVFFFVCSYFLIIEIKNVTFFTFN